MSENEQFFEKFASIVIFANQLFQLYMYLLIWYFRNFTPRYAYFLDFFLFLFIFECFVGGMTSRCEALSAQYIWHVPTGCT